MYYLLLDLLNGYSLIDIRLLCIQIVFSLILTFFLILLLKRKKTENPSLKLMLVINLVIVAVISLSKFSVPLAIIGMAIIIAIFKIEKIKSTPLSTIGNFIIAFGCGSSNLIITALIYCFFLLPIVFFYKESSNDNQV